MDKEKVIIFGASNLGEIAYNVLKDKYNICFFCDNSKIKIGKYFCNLKIIDPQSLCDYKDNKIIIASMYYDEISTQLKNMGLEQIYIFSYCDGNDRTYNKRYSIDKMCNVNLYNKISMDKEFKEKFIEDFSLIYDKSAKVKKNSLKEKNKKILVAAYLFPPIGGSGVQRTLKFVKYLKEYGWEPIVITCGTSFSPDNRDTSLLDDIPKDIKVIRINHDKFNSEQLDYKTIIQIVNVIYGVVNDDDLMWKFLKEIKDHNCKNRKLILTPDEQITWINSVLETIEDIIDINDINLVYTTSAPYSDHFIGLYLKKKYNIPWVADFRDEWTNNNYSSLMYKNSTLKYDIERKMEENIVNNADKIITVTPLSTYNYIENFALPESKVVTITNGYDENDFKNIKNIESYKEKFIILHLGTLYYSRSPKSLIQSVNELIEEKKILDEDIEIKLVGKVSLDILKEIEELNKLNVVKIEEYLPHKESLIEAEKSSALFLPIGKEKSLKLVYTGKVFEYLRLHKPIVALSPKGSVVEKILNETRCGKNFECDDVSEIKSYILELYNCWKKGEYKLYFDENQIKNYERKSLTKKLSKIFEGLLIKNDFHSK